MATLIPTSNVEAAYEDMFKEITRKLYGEETGNGLHTLGTPVAQVATTGPTAPEGERSFTNLQIDRSSAPTIEYEHNAGAAAVAAATAAAQNTNVVIQQQPEGSVVVATTGGNFKSEDHLSTAFGLAALMQNGFTTTTGATILSTQALNKVVAAGQQQQQQQNTNIVVAGDQQQRWSTDITATAVGGDQQPQIVQWTTGGKLQSYTTAQQQQQQQQQQLVATPKSKSKNRNDHSTAITTTEVIYTSPSTSANNVNATGSIQTQQQTTPTSTNVPNTGNSGGSTNSSGGGSRKKSNANSNNQQNNSNNNNNNGGVQIQKRYGCTHCPYSTDRRDLYTRHENIHKDEKPFQCYACLKQFNRADHVKKHFLRMHREMQYDINKTRRHVPANSSNHHAGGRGNVTITAISNTSSNTSGASASPEQKPNIFHAANVQLDNAFLEGQRQPTSSSLSIAETIEAVATAADAPLPQMKQEKIEEGGAVTCGVIKPKREKRFTCCYCPWSGADKWGLKRHLNTHTKPFVCLLCDYKAARSERLATHVLKVHNKRACNKCSFLADTQEEYQTHINEVHLLKMDAISRNTASVAQDFHKAGGVHELKLPANHQLLFNNKLPTHWTTKEAAALLHSLSKNSNSMSLAYQQQQQHQRSKYNQPHSLLRQRQHSTGEDDENTPSSASSTTSSDDGATNSPMKLPQRSQQHKDRHKEQHVAATTEQRKAMSAFLSKNFDLQTATTTNEANEIVASSNNNMKRKYQQLHDQQFGNDEDQENQVQLIKSPPAYKYPTNINTNNTKTTKSQRTNNAEHNTNTHSSQQREREHRLDLFKDNKENTNNTAATFLTTMEYQNLNKIGTQFQNYVKDIINKYYAETPLMFPAMPTATTTGQQSQHQQHLQKQQNSPTRKRMLSETEEYIEYLKNKEDITLTITPKVAATNVASSMRPPSQKHTPSSKRTQQCASTSKRQQSPKKHTAATQHIASIVKPRKTLSQLATLLPLLADAASQQAYLAAPLDFSKKATPQNVASTSQQQQQVNEAFTTATNAATIAATAANFDKRSSRKQAQPKKIRAPPEVVVAMLRDKYLNRMVDRKLSCAICSNSQRSTMLLFSYHTKGSLALHRLWKHSERQKSCLRCGESFKHRYSLGIHCKRVHDGRSKKLRPACKSTKK